MSTTGISKHSRPVGVRAKDDRITPVNGMDLCDWHTNGVPDWAQGAAWFVRGCPACKAKVDAGKTTEAAPAPRDLIRLRKFGRWVNRERTMKANKARRAYEAALVPGRECT